MTEREIILDRCRRAARFWWDVMALTGCFSVAAHLIAKWW